jgi:hypothetical protein
MAEGTVIARVFTSDAMIPIEGATVTVMQTAADGSVTLLAIRFTDESGKTAPFSVQAPELSDSLEPEQGQPFTELDLAAYHPDYERILVEHVQIFAGIQTVQPFELVPLKELPASVDQAEIFTLPVQDL